MSDFSSHEVKAFDAFRQKGEVDAMAVLVDHALEEGMERYADLLRFLCHPPVDRLPLAGQCPSLNTPRPCDWARSDFEPIRFFLSVNGRGKASTSLELSLRSALCQAYAEAEAMKRELTGRWRFLWHYSGAGTHGSIRDTWGCVLDGVVSDETVNLHASWKPLNSLSGIDLGSTGRVPQEGFWDRKTGIPYGPDSYCRVVMAELALPHVELPPELREWPKIDPTQGDWPVEAASTYEQKQTRGDYQKSRKRKRKSP